MLAFWDGVAKETEAFIAAVRSSTTASRCPLAPGVPQDAKVSMRWMLLHLVEESSPGTPATCIVRESIDGTRAMG